MKILFLMNKTPYPPKDGGSIASLAMINAFVRAGHDTTVLAMNTRKHHVTPWDIPDEVTNKMTLHLVEVPALVTSKAALRNLFFSKLPYNAERFIDEKYSEKLVALLQTYTYDVIQVEGLYLLPYVPTIRKYSTAVIAYRSHNIEHEIWARTTTNTPGIKKFYLQNLTRRMQHFETSMVDNYDLLVPITRRDADKLAQMGSTKPCWVVPAGVDFEPKAETGNFTLNLFYIGALDWGPNQEGLLWFIDKCFPLILEKRPDAKLRVAGRNAPEWFETKLAHHHIEYLGEIDDASLFMKQNGVMIVPLFSGSGMRVKIIEGMAHAKAIVSTPVGCEGIDAQNGEHICIADNPADFAEYVITLLGNKQQVVELGQKAAQFVAQRYNNDELISKLIAFYKQYLA